VRLGARDKKNGAYIRKAKATEDADEVAEQFRPRVVLGHRVARGAYIKGTKILLYYCYYCFTTASFWATELRVAPILRVQKYCFTTATTALLLRRFGPQSCAWRLY
jgi:hypothetical protein